MDLDSPFEVAPRACDRCHSLKTQCPFGNPCGRCERLGLTCTNDRPQRARGRPPKGTNRSRSAHTSLQHSPEDAGSVSSQSAPPSTEVWPFLRDLPELSLSQDVISSVVRQFLSSTPALGLYSIIPACTNLELAQDHPMRQIFEDVLLQPEIRCALVAIALELYGPHLPRYKQKKAKADRDYLHTAALSFFQKMSSNGNQLTAANGLCLLLLSHTWSMVEQFPKISIRWCSLARFVFDHGKVESGAMSPYSRELERRTNIGLSLQECVLTLTHNCVEILQPRSYEPSTPLPFATDEEWHSMGQISDFESPISLESHSYFSLFSPFINILKNIVQEHPIGSPQWIHTEARLDDYFFQFPEDLLQFSNVKYAYQFEAMIWLHGLFIVLYSTRDIINLLKTKSYRQVDRFCHILEHSLLLSEILHPLLTTDPTLESLSPTTVYFITLSTTVQSLALQTFLSHDQIPPTTLLIAAKYHMETLQTLQTSYTRCNKSFIAEFSNLLASVLDASNVGTELSFSAERLFLYRWTRYGTGIVEMREEDAESEWNYVEGPGARLWGRDFCAEELVGAVLGLCEPKRRICEGGFLDLSIMIPM